MSGAEMLLACARLNVVVVLSGRGLDNDTEQKTLLLKNYLPVGYFKHRASGLTTKIAKRINFFNKANGC